MFSFELLKSKGPPQQRSIFGLVKSAEARDAQTVHFDLTGSGDRELPLLLAAMPVLPKHATDVARFAKRAMRRLYVQDPLSSPK